jgi:hypothetical protein
MSSYRDLIIEKQVVCIKTIYYIPGEEEEWYSDEKGLYRSKEEIIYKAGKIYNIFEEDNEGYKISYNEKWNYYFYKNEIELPKDIFDLEKEKFPDPKERLFKDYFEHLRIAKIKKINNTL